MNNSHVIFKSKMSKRTTTRPTSAGRYAKKPKTVMTVPRPMPRKTYQEANFVDLGAASYAANTTGTITLLNTIVQGPSQNERIGKRVYLKSLLMRGFAFGGTTAVINDVATMIVYDKRPNGVVPAITDILTSANSSAFMNDNNTSRFEVLRRKDYVLIGNSTTPSTGQEAISVDEYIPLKKRPMIFNALGTGAIADIDEGALYLITVGNNVAGTTAASVSVQFRTRFTEQ